MSEALQWVEVPWRERQVQLEVQWIAPRRAHAPLLVFLHEGLGSVAMWRDFPQRLCDALQCRGLVYSRPGYGRSTPRAPDDHWAPDFMHQQAHEVLPALLHALAIDPISDRLWLFGHSDGGSIALLHAALPTALVRGLVVLAPHVLVEPVSIASIEQARQAYESTDLREKLSRYHDDVDSAFRGWNDIWLHPDFRRWNIVGELSRIRCPILAVQGVDDIYGTMRQIDEIARHTPQARLVKLAACGHSPHRDQPDKLIDAVTQFIQRH